ncbi:murein transglycosylase [Pelistega indica]|uniref:Murein transglycosylase n=1 Tax=Pelistega indica TaxID=1414851 RepID=V8G9J1_9BURK|nr:lytic murein transglycosylase B [Pelistega indica]ETD73070.1 murein transglycosylase [Pelistega indica]
MKKVAHFALLALSSLLLSACASQTSSPDIDNRDSTPPAKTGWQVENSTLSSDKATFIKQVSNRYNIPKSFIEDMLARAQINNRAIALMSPKKTSSIKRHWPTYRNRFVEPIRIRKGTAFWHNNQSTLAAAEKKYGVPAAIIAGIIGVETVYGEQMGSFSVLDALYSLGFYHPDPSRPEKAQMFRNQLAALIELTHKGKFDGFTALGSFAGASGLGQFMPISILHYGVDADKDGKVDLRNSTKNAIYSVANFLSQHGWQANMPVFAPARLPSSPARFVNGGLEPSMSWQELQTQGATTSTQGQAWQHGKNLGVIDLKDEVNGNTEYRIATQNFFVITKYNRSYFYAASVADLASVLARQQISQGKIITLP